MKIRLQEIELGTKNPNKSQAFFTTVLGLETSIEQKALKVFKSGVAGVDFNVSTHLAPEKTVISFLTDDLQAVVGQLQANAVVFSGPEKSHLGMIRIEFTDPDNHLIRVNQATKESPDWLKI
jgi:catechol 2,3-dioxygenase-like lactoylglutathione lyase family enzyme